MKAVSITQAEKNRERLREKRENQILRKAEQLNRLNDEEVSTELKNKGLPTFGTKQERLERLKKHYGVDRVLQILENSDQEEENPPYQQYRPQQYAQPQQYSQPQQYNPQGYLPNSQQSNQTYQLYHQYQQQQQQYFKYKQESSPYQQESSPYQQSSPIKPQTFTTQPTNFTLTHNNQVPTSQVPTNQLPTNQASTNQTNGVQKRVAPKSSVVDEIEKLKQKREERRNKMDNIKRIRAEKEAENEAQGRTGDVEFQMMIAENRYKEHIFQQHSTQSKIRLCVCVRKRPIFQKEEGSGEIDAISSANPRIAVFDCKFKVDGITKFIDTQEFTFDHTFNENETTEELYKSTVQPLVDFIMQQGIVTCFAYGQTGSGKTFTMKGVQQSVIQDLFKLSKTRYVQYGLRFYVSFFEIYGGRCLDLLNNKNRLTILEDKNQNVQIPGLVERTVDSVQEMMSYIDYANSIRTTHQTVANDTSSRSHAICQIVLKDPTQKTHGKLLLVDLAGSERAQDTQSNNRQRRIEGAEINKSLLALKECVRAMDNNKHGGNNHVPFRASKLTLVLRDSFTSKNDRTRIVMIACVSPGHSSADHSLNTLRYADRLKDRAPENQRQVAKYGVPEELMGNYQPERYLARPLSEKKVNPATQEIQQYYPSQWEVPTNNKETDKTFKSRNTNSRPDENMVHSKSQNKNGTQSKWTVSSSNQEDLSVPAKNANKHQKSNGFHLTGESPGLFNDFSDDELDASPEQIRRANQDFQYVKQTMNLEPGAKPANNEFFDFQEKITTIVDEQEEIFVSHMTAIKEDAKLLTQESELISKVQGLEDGDEEFDVDNYVQQLEKVIKKKMHLYALLDKKVSKFKKHLKEEEEISARVRGAVYY